MTIAQLAAFKFPTTGTASRQSRMDAITVLQWTGRIRENTVKKWDAGRVDPAQVAADVRAFMGVLAQTSQSGTGRVLTDGQRAAVEQAAHEAARVAKEIEAKHPEVWGENA